MPTTRRDSTPATLARQAVGRTPSLTRAPIVVKVGGSSEESAPAILADVAALRLAGALPIVVHGGGPEITRRLQQQGVPTTFHQGRRVTDQATLAVALATLAGQVNKELVRLLQNQGIQAIGLSGVDGGLLMAKRRDPELGLVGDVTAVDTGLLRLLLERGAVPVLAPVALEATGERAILNVNADSVAGAVARALPAEALLFLTDVDGVLGTDGSSLPRLTGKDAAGLIASGVVYGGMIPKVEACLLARSAGARAAILDGRQPQAALRWLSGCQLGTLFC
ncbi:MAG: acetylglutamate kinase [Chloroflexi bacterium]|nr:acetylglutamate kinase [Chloroflexota bacterium]